MLTPFYYVKSKNYHKNLRRELWTIKNLKKYHTYVTEKYIRRIYNKNRKAGENDYLHDTLIITPPSAKYGLTFQWGHLYNRFQCNCDLKAIVALIIQEIMIRKETAYDIDTAKYFNPDYVKEHISFRLIHAEQGQMILENCPHRKILDLAVVYTIPIVADESRKTVVDVLFKNDHCGMTGITEKMLYEMAYKNTQNVNPPVIVPLSHYLVLANGELDMKKKIHFLNTALTVREKNTKLILYQKERLQMELVRFYMEK